MLLGARPVSTLVSPLSMYFFQRRQSWDAANSQDQKTYDQGHESKLFQLCLAHFHDVLVRTVVDQMLELLQVLGIEQQPHAPAVRRPVPRKCICILVPRSQVREAVEEVARRNEHAGGCSRGEAQGAEELRCRHMV